MSEKEKFNKWLEEEKAMGLVSIRVSPNYENLNDNFTEEDLYRELNAMINGEVVSNIEIFPNRQGPPYNF